MKGLTSPLWPIHTKPFPDELLSSWLIRLAHGHGLKVQTFCNLVFGNSRQVWNRDIDRLAPAWLIDELIARTGTSREIAYGTTLRAYEGWLYPSFRSAGALHWILILKMYHRKRTGYGLQYCPRCLKADAVPYFRKRWRVAFNLVCPTHRVRLLDRCPQCGSGVSFHRVEQGKPNVTGVESLSICHECGFDLKYAKALKIGRKSDEVMDLLMTLCGSLEDRAKGEVRLCDDGHFGVLHQLCKSMYSPRKALRLTEHVAEQTGLIESCIEISHLPFESRLLQERTELLMLGLWLMVDLETRLGDAWRSRAIRYNHMLKDFPNPPDWYVELVGKFANWRKR